MFRLFSAACQVCSYALDLQGYSKEFMFGTSWAVSAPYDLELVQNAMD